MGHRLIIPCYNSLLPEIDMVNDRLLPEFKFGKQFKMVLPSRDSWLSNELISVLNQSIVFFVDGSRHETSSGFGIYCPSYDLRYSGSLGRYSTVFQAELTALTWSIIETSNFKTINLHLVFCTDSKSDSKHNK